MVKIAETRVEFAAAPSEVWQIVTNLQDYAWRSDLQSLTVVEDGKAFVETNHRGLATMLRITELSPYRRYALSLENRRFTGDWLGVFREKVGGGVTLQLRLRVRVRNPLLRVLAVFFWNLRKYQAAYLADLQRAVAAQAEITVNKEPSALAIDP